MPFRSTVADRRTTSWSAGLGWSGAMMTAATASTTDSTPTTWNPRAGSVRNTAPRTDPMAAPRRMPSPTRADTVARRLMGTRSGRTALRAEVGPLRQTTTRHHQPRIEAKLSAEDSGTMSTATPTAPPTTHGVREPKRDRVRSESAPSITLDGSATSAATAVSRASSRTLSSGAISAIRAGSSTAVAAVNGADQATVPTSRPTPTRTIPVRAAGGASTVTTLMPGPPVRAARPTEWPRARARPR